MSRAIYVARYLIACRVWRMEATFSPRATGGHKRPVRMERHSFPGCDVLSQASIGMVEFRLASFKSAPIPSRSDKETKPNERISLRLRSAPANLDPRYDLAAAALCVVTRPEHSFGRIPQETRESDVGIHPIVRYDRDVAAPNEA